MARKESTFCTELKRSTPIIQPCFWWKIPDAGFRNYFDVVCCANGKFIAIEAKISKSLTSIPLHTFFLGREHELQALRKVVASGGYGWVIINVYNPHKWNYALCIPVLEYIDLMSEILPAKSIKLTDERLNRYVRMERVNQVWDLTRII